MPKKTTERIKQIASLSNGIKCDNICSSADFGPVPQYSSMSSKAPIPEPL